MGRDHREAIGRVEEARTFEPSPLAFSPDGMTLPAARKQQKPNTKDYDAVLWDVATGQEGTRFPG